MYVRVYDSVNAVHQITTDNPQVLGAWFADLAAIVQTNNSSMMPIRMEVYPTGDYNAAEQWGRPAQLTAQRCRWLAQRFEQWQEEDAA